MLIDTHAHLFDEKFSDPKLIIERAKEHGVNKIICASYDILSSQMAVKIASENEGVFALVGVHPEEVDKVEDGYLQTLAQLAKNKKVVGIGEIGLDYHFTKETIDLQKKVFIEQIKLAHALGLPIVIHMRDATGDVMKIIREYKQYITNGGVFHCFNASKEILNEITAMGFLVSYGGAITFNNANNLREIVAQSSPEFILTETDCPYMAPVPLRGQTNEPKNIEIIIKKIAEIKNIDEKSLEKIIENNAKKIFKI